eukprot:5695609-Amphidinium_carterae.1
MQLNSSPNADQVHEFELNLVISLPGMSSGLTPCHNASTTCRVWIGLSQRGAFRRLCAVVVRGTLRACERNKHTD